MIICVASILGSVNWPNKNPMEGGGGWGGGEGGGAKAFPTPPVFEVTNIYIQDSL